MKKPSEAPKDWYDKKVTAERLVKLRSEYEKKLKRNISAQELVKHIYDKTGIVLGGNTYNKHERFTNDVAMSIEVLVALSKFYDVSYDYILGFSDTRHPERDDISQKYGLTDDALDRLENIHGIIDRQEQREPGVPTDMEVINAFFESAEFEDLVTVIRKSCESRLRMKGIYMSDSYGAARDFRASLTDEQKETIQSNGLSLLTMQESKEFIDYKMHNALRNVVDDVLDKLCEDE